MRAVGIISEYNPFHEGHLYHIRRTREAFGKKCAIVAVMSGNFVQRGELAVFSKHSRAEAAVSAPNAVDLVLELPVPYAIASAERFARVGVELIDATGVCEAISFGSECGDLDALRGLARALCSDEFEAKLREKLQNHSGESFATIRQRAARELKGVNAELLSTPNNTLAIEYLRAIERSGSALGAFTVRREGAEHDADYTDGGYASAAHIRSLMQSGAAYSSMKYLPDGAVEVFIREMARGAGPVVAPAADAMIMSALRRLKAADFARLADVSEGLEHRLVKSIAEAKTVAEAADRAKTKRYAHSRIRRIYMAAFLGIDAGLTASKPQYLRVLAASARGRTLLAEMKKTAKLPILTKPADVKKLGDDARRLFEAEALAGDLYALARPSSDLHAAGEDYTRSPFMRP